MVAKGSPNVEGSPANQEYMGLLDKLAELGWGGMGGHEADIKGAYRDYSVVLFHMVAPNVLDTMSPEEVAERLNIVDKDGRVLPGLDVTHDEKSRALEVKYHGLYEEWTVEALTGMIALTDSKPE